MAEVRTSSELFYGIFTANSTLFLACDAQSKLEGLQVIDQIIFRRNKGSSITTTGGETSIKEIPTEIWSQVRRQLIFSAIDETERETFEKYRCDSEDNIRKSGRSKCDGLNVVERGTLASLGKCSRCYDNVSVSSFLESFENAGSANLAIRSTWVDKNSVSLSILSQQILLYFLWQFLFSKSINSLNNTD